MTHLVDLILRPRKRPTLATAPTLQTAPKASILAKVKKIFAKRPSFRSFSLDTRPRLALPKPPALGSFSPPRFFFRGAFETDRKKNPEPIWHLLTESLEEPFSQPIPQHAPLMRSICKGHGFLKQNNQGLFYLDVDNLFITAMTPHLRQQGLIRPPYFNIFSSPEGAHIPVISKREANFHYLNEIKEKGKQFSFFIEGLYSSKPDTWPEVEEVWFLKVQSPELEALRQRYFLTSRPNGHDFHIVVGVKTREKARQRPAPLLRINPAFIAA